MKTKERKQSAEKTMTAKKKPQDTKRTTNQAELLEKAIQSVEDRLNSNQVKATFADLIRLLQMRKELASEAPRQITVTWIDSCEMELVAET